MASHKSILPKLCQKASLFVRTNGVACFSLGVADGRLHLRAMHRTDGPPLSEFWFSLDESSEFIDAVKACISTGQSVRIPVAMSVGPIKSIQCSMVVPIVWRRPSVEDGDEPFEQTIGVMLFWDPRESSEISEDDKKLAEGLARQTASVLVSERLIEIEEASIAIASAAVAIVLLDRDDEIHLINPMAESILNGGPMVERKLAELDQAMQLSSLVNRARVSDGGHASASFTSKAGESYSASAQVARSGECVIVLSKVHMSSTAEQIVGQVAHELRTPLTIIQGYVMTVNALLDANGSDEDVAECKNMLEASELQCGRMARLLGDTLNVSRIQAGRQLEIHPLTCDVSEMIGLLLSEMDDALSRHDVHVSIPGECTAFVDCDKILSVVDNLLRNAIKYSDPGKGIWLTVEKTDVLTICVRDEGIGIAPEDIDRIGREPGYRTETSKDQAAGIGLGLVYVRKAVEGHGGTLSISSELGKGSEFRVEIPLERDPIDESGVVVL